MIDDEFVEDDDMVVEEEADSAEDYDVSDEKEDAVDLEESETNPTVSVPSGGIEIIMDLREWLKSPWSTDWFLVFEVLWKQYLLLINVKK